MDVANGAGDIKQLDVRRLPSAVSRDHAAAEGDVVRAVERMPLEPQGGCAQESMIGGDRDIDANGLVLVNQRYGELPLIASDRIGREVFPASVVIQRDAITLAALRECKHAVVFRGHGNCSTGSSRIGE